MKTLVLLILENSKQDLQEGLCFFPSAYKNSTDCEVLVIDDAAEDRSADWANQFIEENQLNNFRVRKNETAYGSGGNQKIGLRCALENHFDVVVIFEKGGLREMKSLPAILKPLQEDPSIDCVIGTGSLGILGWFARLVGLIQNMLSKAVVREWHSLVRAYRTRALSEVAFEFNTSGAHFDTEILLQFVDKKKTIVETPLSRPTRLFSSARNLGYYLNSLKSTLKYRLHRYNLVYDLRFHPEYLGDQSGIPRYRTIYEEKFDEWSPHSLVCTDPRLIPEGSTVLDIGCSTGYISRTLNAKKHCRVTGVDILPPAEVDATNFTYLQLDLESSEDEVAQLLAERRFDVVLLLDVLEHLTSPERFLLATNVRPSLGSPRFVMSTGNVAFIAVRLMLLFGFFNYGEKGILDISHKRLFSYRTFHNLLEQTGFVILKEDFFPVPFQKLGFQKNVVRVLEMINRWLIKLWPSLFSYQIMFQAIPLREAAGVCDPTTSVSNGARDEDALRWRTVEPTESKAPHLVMKWRSCASLYGGRIRPLGLERQTRRLS